MTLSSTFKGEKIKLDGVVEKVHIDMRNGKVVYAVADVKVIDALEGVASNHVFIELEVDE